MAIVVCVTGVGDEAKWSQSDIYLSQDFYELFFKHYLEECQNSPLKQVVSIGYDDELRLSVNQVREIVEELKEIKNTSRLAHSQLQPLLHILEEAVAKKCEVVVGGDMYPDLSKCSQIDSR